MAGFCTFCGNPLPEDGICPCRAQANPQQPDYQPQQPQQPEYQTQQPPYPQYQTPYPTYPPYPQQPMAPARQGPSVLSKFLSIVSDYLKDPVRTSRTMMDRRDIVNGGLSVALCAVLILLGSMFYILARGFDFPARIPAWIVMGIFAPSVAVGITFCVLFALARIAKISVDPTGLLAATAINTVIPACLLALSMLLGMIGPFVFELFAILMFAAWIVTTFTMIFQVLNIKMNIVSIALLIAGIAVAYILIIMMLNWFLFNGSTLLYISDFTPSYDIFYSWY